MLQSKDRPQASDTAQNDAVELSIVMPCLNEAETLATCIRKARGFLAAGNVRGEVIVADNGSTDGSQEIAVREGARVVAIEARGYGAAIQGGVAAARGRFVVMGDADDSYDFSRLQPFLDELRAGADLVMGNRFRGGIAPGAMPFLHRYVGNPILSFIGRLFFGARVGDFHCGLRGFNRDRLIALDLRTTGMEFASEMVVRARLAGHRIAEVPTTLHKDGRSRPPHLRTWRDGWQHLRFLLIYSPKWLFFYPGIVLLLGGLVGTVLLLPGPVHVGGVAFDIHSFIVACVAILVGLQSLSMAAVARRFAMRNHFIPASPPYTSVLDALTLERLLVVALVMVLVGIAGVVSCVLEWRSAGFGPLQYAAMLRFLMLSLTAVAAGMQLAFTAFLGSIMDVPTRH